MKNLVKKLFTQEDLAAIGTAIGIAEKTTSGEIRVSVRQKRRWSERKLTIEEITRREFELLGMSKTRDRTGVLFFLLLQERKFFILADQGIHAKVEEGTWTKIAGEISSHFVQNQFRHGIISGIQAAGEILSKHFPRKSDDTNELPNDVHVQ